MALTFDTANLMIESDDSITDLPAFHASLRDWEDSEVAAVYPVTHTWKALDLGGGAYFYQCDLVNGWTLSFPTPGNYTIVGNLNGTIEPVAGVYVERKTSAAFVTTAVGGSGPTADSIADAVRAELATELARLMDLARIHGLLPGTPLVVSPTARQAGAVEQTVTKVGDTVTVERV